MGLVGPSTVELAFQPLAGGEPNPIVGVGELNREIGRNAAFGLRGDLVDGLLDLGHGFTRFQPGPRIETFPRNRY
jgi:hypothetical protein